MALPEVDKLLEVLDMTPRRLSRVLNCSEQAARSWAGGRIPGQGYRAIIQGIEDAVELVDDPAVVHTALHVRGVQAALARGLVARDDDAAITHITELQQEVRALEARKAALKQDVQELINTLSNILKDYP